MARRLLSLFSVKEASLEKQKNIGLFFAFSTFPTLFLSPRSDPPKTMRKGFLTPSKESGEAKSKSSPGTETSTETTSIADDVSKLLAENLDLDAPGGASSSSSSSSSSSTAAPAPLMLTDVPNQVLVSIFIVAMGDDERWARLTIPFVCKAFRDLYCSRDASPLHDVIFLEFAKEVAAAEEAAARRSSRREPVVRASRVLSWARTHAESVNRLGLNDRSGASLGDFNATNLAQLVAVVGPRLTELGIFDGFEKLVGPPLWAALRPYVVPARKMCGFQVMCISKGLSVSDVEPLVQLRGSLEVLSLWGSVREHRHPSVGLRRFPESFLALTKLQSLILNGHFRIKAIPAGISNLKKLKHLTVAACDLRSLPKELGALRLLEELAVSSNAALGPAPDDVAFPPGLKGMNSLRLLYLQDCDLRRVPAFVRELSSLEEIMLDSNERMQIDAPLDDLVECCPRLILVDMRKGRGGTWTPQSLAHLNAFKAKLQKKNPKAQVEFYEFRVFVFFFCFCSFLFRTVFGERERERERESRRESFSFLLCSLRERARGFGECK